MSPGKESAPKGLYPAGLDNVIGIANKDAVAPGAVDSGVSRVIYPLAGGRSDVADGRVVVGVSLH
jgi:hypothetical protein